MTKRFKPIFTITNLITAGLARIERARGFLEAATLSEAWVREMGRRALILEAHHTTHILDHGSLTIQDFEGLCPEVNRRSLQRDLKAMVDMGMLASEGSTNKLVYRMKETG
jgi:hypothetical protein